MLNSFQHLANVQSWIDPDTIGDKKEIRITKQSSKAILHEKLVFCKRRQINSG